MTPKIVYHIPTRLESHSWQDFNLFCKYRNARRRGRQADESDAHEEEVHMTEAQKEEEAIIKTTFAFYEKNKGGAQIELFELPMLLEGKSNQMRADSLSPKLEAFLLPSESERDCRHWQMSTNYLSMFSLWLQRQRRES